MSKHIAVVGLGYVGLPLAHAFAKGGYTVTGFDINDARVAELNDGHDSTNELSDEQLSEVKMKLSSDPASLGEADVVIVCLPTPVDTLNTPDLTILKTGTETVGKHMKRGSIIVFESTVYPGTTEEICGPILEHASGMKCGTDFFLGYSPERINPGDKEHTVTKILKIVSGQDEKTTDTLCDLYGSIITAGIHRAPSIKVAEMGKAIENAQRDLNIAFVNEIAVLCHAIGISTKDVLDAAGTKWNFLPFKPGLVGGHCIGVDPYYLVEKARQLGIDTHVIAAGRAVNDGMSLLVTEQVSAHLSEGASVLVLGLSFKENVPDTRNSKSGEVITLLKNNGYDVKVHDAEHTEQDIQALGYEPGELTPEMYDAVLLLVPHREYLEDRDRIINSVKKGGLLYDLKSILDRQSILSLGRIYASL